MLFIHGSLKLGGVETFFIRIAKARSEKGSKTKILLLSSRSNNDPGLVADAQKYADIYFFEELLAEKVKFLVSVYPYHLSQVAPLNNSTIETVLSSVSHIHVSTSFSAYFAMRILNMTNKNIPITIGVYHSLEFLWGTQPFPFFERANRDFFYNKIDRKNIVFFNQGVIDLYEKKTAESFSYSKVFPLGVIDCTNLDVNIDHEVSSPNRNMIKKLVIGSVGRLVAFKSYNMWMLDVIYQLKEQGVSVVYVVYGNGPIFQDMLDKVSELGLEKEVELKGNLNYSEFKRAVSKFDLFVGSGTAIVEAASLGVPSIIGIENIEEPMTYGFLNDIPGVAYNEDGLYAKKGVTDTILDYVHSSNEDKKQLSKAHVKKARLFSIQKCSDNFDSIKATKIDSKYITASSKLSSRLLYSLSFFVYSLSCRLKGSSFSKLTREV